MVFISYHLLVFLNFDAERSWERTLTFFPFIDNIRDDLEQIRTEIGNVSEKLDTLKMSATKDEGQFLEIIKRQK